MYCQDSDGCNQKRWCTIIGDETMNIKIIIATHKPYWMPDDDIYLPLHVGAEGKIDASGNPLDLGFVKDNTGDHISEKNANYCELTGLYWAWKNLDADYVGLAHYRRHFTTGGHSSDKKSLIITGKDLETLLNQTDILLPKPRNYWIETNYSQYVHAHHAEDLDVTREILKEKYPQYIQTYDAYMKRTKGHRFNMFIMKREKFDAYCEWLFDILFELEKRLDISDYNQNDARVFGFVSERLLDVWLETNKYTFKELSYVFMEEQNWLVKGGNFLKRKMGKK